MQMISKQMINLKENLVHYEEMVLLTITCGCQCFGSSQEIISLVFSEHPVVGVFSCCQW